MTASLLGLLWGLVVVHTLRPTPMPTTHARRRAAEAPAHGSARAAARHDPPQAHPWWWAPASTVGGWVRRGPPANADDRARRVVGAAVLGLAGASLASLVVGPVPVLGAVGLGALRWARRRRRAQRATAGLVVEALPEVVDLLRVAVDAGSTVPVALRAVAPLAPPPFDVALRAVVGRAERGERLADALDHLPVQLGEVVRPLAAALQGAERYGTPLTAALERLAVDVRAHRRQRAEEAARTLPVRLVFPLVLCTLPSLVLLTIAPVVAGAVASLRL